MSRIQGRLRPNGVFASWLLASSAILVSGGTAVAQDVTTLSLWSRATTVSTVTEPLVEAFNASHDDIQVQLTSVPDAQYISKFGATARGGSVPDIVTFDDINAPIFAASRLLTDLTDFVGTLPDADTLSPGQMRLATYQGATYAAPFSGGASVMFYNKDLFQAAGLDPDQYPQSWDDLVSNANTISALGEDTYGISTAGSCAGCLEFTLLPMIWASGGTVFTEAGPDQTTTFAESAVVGEMFSMLQGLWESGDIMPTDRTEAGPTWGQNFLAGQVGIHFGPIQLNVRADDAGLNYGIAPIPGKEPGSYATFAGGDVIGIPAASENIAAAKEFVRWVYETEQQLMIADGGFTPGQLAVADEAFNQAYPNLSVAVTALKKGDAPKSLATSSIFNDPNGPWIDAVNRIVFSGEDPADVLPEIDETSTRLIVQAYSVFGN